MGGYPDAAITELLGETLQNAEATSLIRLGCSWRYAKKDCV